MQQVAHKVWTSVYQERTSAFALTDGCSGSLCNRATQDSYVSTLNTKRLNFYRGQIASARIDICSSNNNNIKTPGVDTVFNLLFSFCFFFFLIICVDEEKYLHENKSKRLNYTTNYGWRIMFKICEEKEKKKRRI